MEAVTAVIMAVLFWSWLTSLSADLKTRVLPPRLLGLDATESG